MRWRFWRPEPTAAEQTLTDLQSPAPVNPLGPPVPPRPDRPPTRRELMAKAKRYEAYVDAAEAHPDPMAGFARIAGLEYLAAESHTTTFGLQVHGVTTGTAGETVLTAPRSEGVVEPGALVGLVLLAAPHNAPGILDGTDAPSQEATLELMEALTRVSTTSATVVSFGPADGDSPATLVVTGVAAADVPLGTLVMR